MKKKQFISSALAAAMLLGTAVPPAGAARFPDTSGHWGESAIDRWSNYGVIVGADGRFHPDAPITRGEMASIIAGMLGLEETAPDRYPDLGGGWYSEAMLKCAAAGILTGDDHGRMRPYDNITGAEIAVMLVKALDLDSTGTSGAYLPSETGYYKPWAQPYITAVASRGISVGNNGGTFQPMQNTSRAAVVAMFDRAVGTYINSPGTYTANGLTIINTSGTVTLRGSASGVIVTDASDRVRLTLDGARVTGKVELRPSDAQLTLDGASVAGDICALSEKARVSLTNKAEAGDIVLGSGARGASVTIAKGTKAAAISADARDVSISVSGTADSVELHAGAGSAAVDIRSGGKVSALVSDADKVTVKGSGSLKRATISGSDNKIDTSGTSVRVEKGASNTRVNGVKKNPGTTTSSSSSNKDKDDRDDSTRYYVSYYVARDGSNNSYDYYTRERVYRGDRADGVSVPKAPEGYKFDAWYTSRSGSGKFDFSTRIRDDYTLYGRWVKKTTTPVDPDPPKPAAKTFQQIVVLAKSAENKLDSAVWDGNTMTVTFRYDIQYNGEVVPALTELAGKLKEAAAIDGSTVIINDPQGGSGLDVSTAETDKIVEALYVSQNLPYVDIVEATTITVTGTNAGTYTIQYKVAPIPSADAATREELIEKLQDPNVIQIKVTEDITMTWEELQIPEGKTVVFVEGKRITLTTGNTVPDGVRYENVYLQAAHDKVIKDFTEALGGWIGPDNTITVPAVADESTDAELTKLHNAILGILGNLSGRFGDRVQFGNVSINETNISEHITRESFTDHNIFIVAGGYEIKYTIQSAPAAGGSGDPTPEPTP